MFDAPRIHQFCIDIDSAEVMGAELDASATVSETSLQHMSLGTVRKMYILLMAEAEDIHVGRKAAVSFEAKAMPPQLFPGGIRRPFSNVGNHYAYIPSVHISGTLRVDIATLLDFETVFFDTSLQVARPYFIAGTLAEDTTVELPQRVPKDDKDLHFLFNGSDLRFSTTFNNKPNGGLRLVA